MKRTDDLKTRLSIVKTWKQKIQESDFSIPQLAKAAKVCRQSIYSALKGETLPNFETIHKIEEVLND